MYFRGGFMIFKRDGGAHYECQRSEISREIWGHAPLEIFGKLSL